MQIQEIQNQLARQSKEEEEIQKRREKERENEQKAQQQYKNWLKKKNQEKMELEKKEKVRWTLIFFTWKATCLQDNTTRYVFFLHRKKLPRRRSRSKSAARGQKRNLQNGWQKQTKKAEALPKQPILQQVGTYYISIKLNLKKKPKQNLKKKFFLLTNNH